MTLLVVDLRPPVAGLGSDAAAAQVLGDALGRILAFVISFVVVGLYWDGHLRIFRVIRTADRALIGLNLAFLIWIAFMPYPTSILGDGPLTRVSVAFYAIVQIGAGISEAAIWIYATRHPALLRSPIGPDVARLVAAQILRGPVIFAISLLIALVSPPLAAASWILLIPASYVIDRRWGRATS